MDESDLYKLKPTERKLFNLLAAEGLVRKMDLIRLLPSYDSRDEDKPEVVANWDKALSFQLSNLRKVLQAHGVGIICQRNGAEANTHYVLSRLMRRE